MPAGGRAVTRATLVSAAPAACEALPLQIFPIHPDWDCEGNDKWEIGEGQDIVENIDDLIDSIRNAEQRSHIDLPAEDGSIETFATGTQPPPHDMVRRILQASNESHADTPVGDLLHYYRSIIEVWLDRDVTTPSHDEYKVRSGLPFICAGAPRTLQKTDDIEF